MPRTMLSNEQWKKLLSVMLSSGRIYDKAEHRMTFEGILYRMRTGIPWRDLPPEFGDWNTIFRRFNLWSQKGVLLTVFKELSKITDSEWLFIDGSIVKAHQHGTGAASNSDESIGKSRGGNSTKIHLSVNSFGLPVHFEISGGQVNDIMYAEALVAKSPFSENVIADKGYDSEKFRSYIEQMGSKPEIPRRKNNCKNNDEMDWCLYQYRHLVENAFARVKNYRAISTRYDKLERNYISMLSMAFTMMWLPMWC